MDSKRWLKYFWITFVIWIVVFATPFLVIGLLPGSLVTFYTIVVVLILPFIMICFFVKYRSDLQNERNSAKMEAQIKRIQCLGKWDKIYSYEDRWHNKITTCAIDTKNRILYACEDEGFPVKVNGDNILDVTVVDNGKVVVSSKYSLLYGTAMVSGGTITSALYIRIITRSAQQAVVTIRLLYGEVGEKFDKSWANKIADIIYGYCIQWMEINKENEAKAAADANNTQEN